MCNNWQMIRMYSDSFILRAVVAKAEAVNDSGVSEMLDQRLAYVDVTVSHDFGFLDTQVSVAVMEMNTDYPEP